MSKQRDYVPQWRGRTIKEAAPELGTSVSTLNRARSHGLIRVVYFGRRPIIPTPEFQRLAREGIPNIPAGYKRLTRGTTRVGRPPKAKAKQMSKAARTKPPARGGERHAVP